MPIAKPAMDPAAWEQIDAQAPEVVKQALEAIEGGSWTEDKSKTEMKIFHTSLGDSKYNAVKGELTIPYSLPRCIGALHTGIEVDENSPKEVREGMLFRHLTCRSPEALAAVEALAGAASNPEGVTISDYTAVMQYVVASTSSMVAPREFVVVRALRELPASPEGHRRVLVCAASKVPEGVLASFPEPTKADGWVRATMLRQAFYFEELGPNETKGVFIAHAEPNGKVPAMIYNQVATHQANLLLAVKQDLDKRS